MRPLRDLLLACLAASILAPVPAIAGLRGAYDPLTTDSGVLNRYEQPALRPLPALDGVERYFAFSTRSVVVGYETSREIWIHANVSRAGFGHTGAGLLDSVRVPLLADPTGLVSYADPAWSPDGRFLAYVATDRYVTHASIYIQEYAMGDLVSAAAVPLGAPILVVSGDDGSHNRHPAWSPDGQSLAFDSDRSRATIDLWTVPVFPSPGTPERQTFDDGRAEQTPAFSPDGTRIAYSTNRFGADEIAIVDLTTPPPHTVTQADTRAAVITPRRNPAWSSDGRSIYYDTATENDPERTTDIWKLDLDTQNRCAMFVDLTADWDPDVSRYARSTPDGVLYDYFLFTSMAAAGIFPSGPNIWRGERVQNCAPPLPMNVDFQHKTLQIGGQGQDLVVTLRFPAVTKAAGYQCQSFDGPLEGVRMRINIIPSPTLLDLPARGDKGDLRQFGATALPQYRDYTVGSDRRIDVRWDRALIESVLVAQGLVGKQVPLAVRAYSNVVGRAFLGYAYLNVNSGNPAAALPRVAAAAPNPFSAGTTIRFSLPTSGTATVRVFDARGSLVRTVARQWYPAGEQHVTWDGRSDGGAAAASGIYYAQVVSGSGLSARARLLLLQ